MQSNGDPGPPAPCKEDMEEFHAADEEAEVSEDEGGFQGSGLKLRARGVSPIQYSQRQLCTENSSEPQGRRNIAAQGLCQSRG